MSATYPTRFPDLFFTAKKPIQGKHINKLFAIMAATLPISVEFQIHQVVLAFQINKARKQCQKKFDFFSITSAIKRRGTNPKKMRKVRGDTGHAAKSRSPEKILKLMGTIFFKSIGYYFLL
jgi:hypothetical protein